MRLDLACSNARGCDCSWYVMHETVFSSSMTAILGLGKAKVWLSS
jgi:hypothetical protein